MSSTSTFKGMNTDNKPSSRVLAPPGGGSSNIFGTSEPVQAPQRRDAPAPKPAQPAPAPQSAQGDRNIKVAPKQGEDSFQNLFGSEKSLNYKNAPQSRQEARSKPVNSDTGSNQSSPSTFDSLFGHAQIDVGKKSGETRKTDSFNRLFGDKDVNKGAKVSCQKLCEDSQRKLGNLSLDKSHSPSANVKSQSSDGLDSSFNRVFGEFQTVSTPGRGKRQSDHSHAFNPITGAPYETPSNTKKNTKEDEDETREGKENEQKAVAGAAPTKPVVAETKEKPSTRVAQPPGGKSSGLW